MRILLLVVVAACTKAGDPREQPKKPDPVKVPVDLPTPGPPVSTDAGNWLLLETQRDAAEVTYLAVELAKDLKTPPKFVPRGKHPSLAWPSWPGHFRAAAAHGNDWWAHAVTGNRVALDIMSGVSGGKSSRSLAVPFEPVALALTGDALFVGGEQAVGWLDLSQAAPKYVELVKRDQQRKAYDLFVRDGDRLLAIDDEIFPMYADLFALDAKGRPTKRLADWSLPGVINGHYDAAALARTTTEDGTLYVVASYGVLDGNGHVLGAIPMRKNKLDFSDDITWPNLDGKTPALVEHEDRGTGKPSRLLAGKALTGWSAIALARQAKLVLLAAGARGVMVLPFDFSTSSKAQLVELDGEVYDLREHGTQIIALVKSTSGKGKLVVLDVANGTVTPVARHELPDVFVRIVD